MTRIDRVFAGCPKNANPAQGHDRYAAPVHNESGHCSRCYSGHISSQIAKFSSHSDSSAAGTEESATACGNPIADRNEAAHTF